MWDTKDVKWMVTFQAPPESVIYAANDARCINAKPVDPPFQRKELFVYIFPTTRVDSRCLNVLFNAQQLASFSCSSSTKPNRNIPVGPRAFKNPPTGIKTSTHSPSWPQH